jgi:hypothetical protein
VQWAVKKKQAFKRDRVGKIELKRVKDRTGWLPDKVAFNIGGTDEGFIFERTDATSTKDTGATNVTGVVKTGYDFLKSCGENGCRWKDFEDAVGAGGNAKTAKDELVKLEMMVKGDDKKWYASEVMDEVYEVPTSEVPRTTLNEVENTIDMQDIEDFGDFGNTSDEVNEAGTT